eukprot:1365387-Amphidinium_carterae.1
MESALHVDMHYRRINNRDRLYNLKETRKQTQLQELPQHVNQNAVTERRNIRLKLDEKRNYCTVQELLEDHEQQCDIRRRQSEIG